MSVDFADPTIAADADLGYWLDPTNRSDFTGHHQLWVWMRAAPTERHYDPEVVECHVTNYDGFCSPLAIFHPWGGGVRYRFCMGGIELNDRKHRRVHFYGFGGDLAVETTAAGATLCKFTSQAPILALADQHALTGILVEEVAAALAEARAAWDVQQRRGSFDARLSAAPPLALYAACLRATAAHLRPLHGDAITPEHRLVRFAERELARLAQEDGGGQAASLVEVLAAQGGE